MKQCFKKKKFGQDKLDLIGKCEEVLDAYAAAGYDMTLRQVYYQMISHDYFPDSWIDTAYNLKNGLAPDTKNTQKNYDRLGDIVNDARLAGLLDWDHVVDRTRSLKGLSHWEDPADIIKAAAESYNLDRWASQQYRPEVWVEKDALSGVFQRVCDELDVPLFSCRGYTSQSEMYSASRRMLRHVKAGQTPKIFHFGDHDPSGIDMSRDIQDRLYMFGVETLEFERMALNMDQVNEYDPPPNPAKLTDSRCAGYVEEFGDESWELDALEPDVLSELVRDAVMGLAHPQAWEDSGERQDGHREQLAKISENFGQVADFVEGLE